MADEDKVQKASSDDGAEDHQETPPAEDPAELKAKVDALEEEKKKLLGALHKERQEKKGKGDSAELEKKIGEIEAKLIKTEREKVVAQFTSSSDETDLAMEYFEKLAVGETDAEKLKEHAKKAALLAHADKNPNMNPAIRAGAAMGSGGRGPSDGADVSSTAVEIGRVFGHTAEKIREAKDRSVGSSLYTKR
jgi:phage-related minor tail protein